MNKINTNEKHIYTNNVLCTKLGSIIAKTHYNVEEHNMYVFAYFQLKATLSKTPYYVSENYKFFDKLVTLNTKQGNKSKSLRQFSASMMYIYNYFSTFDHNMSLEYPTYQAFFDFSRSFPNEFYKPDFLLKYIHTYFELIFMVKKLKPKKKTKKKKTTPKLLISYIPKQVRSSLSLRIINAYLNSFNTNTRYISLGNALLYLLFTGKQSFLYKKKLSMYTKLLEKKKFY